MSKVAEIEAVIQTLSPSETDELASWLTEYREMIQASAQMFDMYDKEEADAAKAGRNLDR